MELHNADGSRAEMSGNGISCLAQAVLLAGLVPGPTVTVRTDAGLRTLDARARDDGLTHDVTVDMGVVTTSGDAPDWIGPGVAAACFARGSRRLHARLLNSRLFGPTIRAWQETRSIPLGAKVTAIVLIVAAFTSTIVFAVSHPAFRIGLAVLGLGLITYLWRIPTRRRG